MEKILRTLECDQTISGHTHNFYNYPARFHPSFARSTIEHFTNPGDCVVDPFMGSGTAGVEALACNRKFLGIDINPVACFLATVKTTPLTKIEIEFLRAWHKTIAQKINLHDKVVIDNQWISYTKYLPWWIRKTIGIIQAHIEKDVITEKGKNFSKAVLLSVGQWALESSKVIPSSKQFVDKFCSKFDIMLNDLFTFQKILNKKIDVPLSQISRRRKIINKSVIDVKYDKRQTMKWVPAKLILTSPPYPGVHVVYNRWQVLGRRETPAPFWVINSKDGNGLSYYTLGDRQQKHLKNYYNNLKKSFLTIRTLCSNDTIIIQLVGFSNPTWQLDKYLHSMEEAGFKELDVVSNSKTRYSRKVPNRKWYTQYSESLSASDREFLLVHKSK